ncbi:MAG: hypothetical protein AB7R89_25765 [Dehalococcoidia bacterium]
MAYHSALETALLDMEIQAKLYGAGSTNGAGVDMQGWDGVAFIASIGAIEDGGTYDLRVVQDSLANFASVTNVTNAAITQVPNTTPNVIVVIDVFRPAERYVRVNSTVATNNVTVSVTSVRYRGQSRLPKASPADQYVLVADS